MITFVIAPSLCLKSHTHSTNFKVKLYLIVQLSIMIDILDYYKLDVFSRLSGAKRLETTEIAFDVASSIQIGEENAK